MLDKLKSKLFKKFSMLSDIVKSVLPVNAISKIRNVRRSTKLTNKHKLEENRIIVLKFFTVKFVLWQITI